jgi:ABC-2 type transport system permease protein
MLWYKSWFETRWRFVFSFVVVALLLAFIWWLGTRPSVSASQASTGPFGVAIICVIWISAFLAGAGVATQPAFQASKGLHGSTCFTLSLPVSRFRLLAVRAGIGWIETIFLVVVMCCGIWAAFPPLRAAGTPFEMLEDTALIVAYASAFYSMAVLMGTFLDDLWRNWGSILVWAALWTLSTLLHVPASFDIFKAVGEASPLVVHTMPWPAAGVSLAIVVICFLTASRIVRVREY